MIYPTLEQVEQASVAELGRWYRFLPSPSNDNQLTILDRICVRFKALGMFTPELSKSIGWGS